MNVLTSQAHLQLGEGGRFSVGIGGISHNRRMHRLATSHLKREHHTQSATDIGEQDSARDIVETTDQPVIVLPWHIKRKRTRRAQIQAKTKASQD